MSAAEHKVVTLLKAELSREFLIGVHEALEIGPRRAYAVASSAHAGHRASMLGQLRNYHSNETFRDVLAAHNARPSELSGSKIVHGQIGRIQVARMAINSRRFEGWRRSAQRRRLAEANRELQRHIAPDIFHQAGEVRAATVFFVSQFSGSIHYRPETVVDVHIAVPDETMSAWLFHEPIANFIQRYETQASPDGMVDNAFPKLLPRRGQGNGQEGA